MIRPLSPASRFGGLYPILFMHSNGHRGQLTEGLKNVHDNHESPLQPLTQKCFETLKKAQVAPTAGYVVSLANNTHLYVANDTNGNHASTFHGLTSHSADSAKLRSKLVNQAKKPHGHLVLHYHTHMTQEPVTVKSVKSQVARFGSDLKDLTLSMVTAMMHKP